MTDQRPTTLDATRRQHLSRRNLIISAGAGVVTLALGRSVVGKDDVHDYHVDDSDDDKKDRDDGDVRPSGTVPPGSAEVLISDDDADGFQPGTITIDLGESVTWVNIDKDPHTATSASFDTGKIDPGEQATVIFEEPGTFPYSCSFHPIMTGIVEVRDETGKVPASSIASPQASPGASPQASPAVGQQATVAIDRFAFDPPDLKVAIGTTVVWTNNESVPHTVTATDDSFGSDTLQKGDTFSHQFTAAGTFDYFCAIHPNMKASVTVSG